MELVQSRLAAMSPLNRRYIPIEWGEVRLPPINLWNCPIQRKETEMIPVCIKPGCINPAKPEEKFCEMCISRTDINDRVTMAAADTDAQKRRESDMSMSEKYPKYYKKLPEGVTEVDVYAVCQLFGINDAAISHAVKKLMLPGARTGLKSIYNDVKEARDTLNRWIELNPKKENICD